jgi:NAD(P)-dependent dehydrogenase (short-subunit alcohol dehydrogenase family)
MNAGARFEGQVAIVTGAASGIGKATAQRLLSEGASVIGVDVAGFSSAEHEVPAGTRLLLVNGDVTDEALPQEVTRRALDELGRLDILVNAAGVLHIASVLEVDRDNWSRLIAVNLTAPFFFAQAAAAAMIAKKAKGRIVNVSSVHAAVSEPGAAPYTASKGGLEAMTRTLATELGPHGITANCVRPGATWTGMARPLYTQEVQVALKARIPLGEIAQPEWVAAAICYLASPEARYTTGTAFDVDGGYSIDGSLPGTSYDER